MVARHRYQSILVIRADRREEHLDRADDPTAAASYLDAVKGLLAKYRYDTSFDLAKRGLKLVSQPSERYELTLAKAETLEQLCRMRKTLSAYKVGRSAASSFRPTTNAVQSLASSLSTAGDAPKSMPRA
ncbi:hypothetical protein ASE71_33080 [Ensifer sp. Root954]|nr:hypothetical protein ASD49_29515 [Ensifer sp. Root1298]KQX85595.1 hypothetical protein ASD41_29380 [Ensifer sp. Root1312]KRC21480.1 hypothetical protein ASE29_30195 [Ensifer sp. Root74]KRD60855.1 hypothetical protein ASE71_33080 [Ensifer sp. Root954]